MKLFFDVPGEPCAQGRPRFAVRGGHAAAYDPEKSKNYKALVRLAAEQAMQEAHWLYCVELPLQITVKVYLEVPASKSKKFKDGALKGIELPTKKPDVDNVLKTIMDALSGVVYKDDKQIVSAIVTKEYSERPHLTVELENW